MARKKRGIFKKILKGVTIVGGTVLGAVTGVGAIKGIVKGTGALAGIAKGLGNIKNKAVNVSQTAAKLVTGSTKEQRIAINQAKDEARADVDRLNFMQKLIDAGKSEEQAASIAGVILDKVEEYSGIGKPKSSFDIAALTKNPVVLGGVGLLGLFLLLRKK